MEISLKPTWFNVSCVVLTILFIALKLAEVIAWSWFWVLSPIFLLALIIGIILAIPVLVIALAVVLGLLGAIFGFINGIFSGIASKLGRAKPETKNTKNDFTSLNL